MLGSWSRVAELLRRGEYVLESVLFFQPLFLSISSCKGTHSCSFFPPPCLRYRQLPAKVLFLGHPTSLAIPGFHFYLFKQRNIGVAPTCKPLTLESCVLLIPEMLDCRELYSVLFFFPGIWKPFPESRIRGAFLVRMKFARLCLVPSVALGRHLRR